MWPYSMPCLLSDRVYGKWSRPAPKPADQDDGVKEQRREGRGAGQTE